MALASFCVELLLEYTVKDVSERNDCLLTGSLLASLSLCSPKTVKIALKLISVENLDVSDALGNDYRTFKTKPESG